MDAPLKTPDFTSDVQARSMQRMVRSRSNHDPAPLAEEAGSGRSGGTSKSIPEGQTICGDNVAVLATLPDECVDLVVTSPPYDDLRAYGGHSWNFEEVAAQLTRVLKHGGVIVWVVADATVDGSETLTSMRQAIHFKDVCDLNVHDTMIYKKAGVGACGSNLAYWQSWEYCFVFSRGVPRRINRIADRKNTSAGLTKWESPKTQMMGARENRKMITAETGTRDNVWTYQIGHFAGDDVTEHPAPFPEALAKDHIASWSNPGDFVLDPFAGSGTTLKAAKELERRWLGIEINPAYVEICRARISQDVLSLFAGGGGAEQVGDEQRGTNEGKAPNGRLQLQRSENSTGETK